MKTKLLSFLILLFFTSTALKAQITLTSEGFDNVPALITAGLPTTIISEGFENVPALLGAGGWTALNTSVPVGTTGWFQGNGATIPAQAGATTSNIYANFNNTTGANTISNWLITPTQSLQNGDVIKFWTRTVTGSAFPDRLEVRLSTLGAGSTNPSSPTDVGSYTVLLTAINPTLTVGGYPNAAYVEYTLTVSGLTGATDCKVAFRYFVENGGPTGDNSNVIAIDTFSITRAAASGPWTALNTSVPVGITGWFQGNGTSIPSQAGAITSSIYANFNNTTGANTISNWLIAPIQSLQNGDEIKFWTRTVTGSTFPDRLEVRLSTLGAGSTNPSSPTDVGSYTVLLTAINPTLTAGGYPNAAYVEYILPVSGLTGATDCKVAFRYFVENGGPAGANSNLIAIDTYSVVRPALSNINFNLENNCTLSPNPVVDVFQLNLSDTVDVSKLKVEIYDMNGRMIKTFGNSSTYSVSDVETGVYLVSISDGIISETKRIIKK